MVADELQRWQEAFKLRYALTTLLHAYLIIFQATVLHALRKLVTTLVLEKRKGSGQLLSMPALIVGRACCTSAAPWYLLTLPIKA